MFIVGDKEKSNATISVRLRNGEDLGEKSLSEFIVMIKELIISKESSKL